jgi:hypothetical protein
MRGVGWAKQMQRVSLCTAFLLLGAALACAQEVAVGPTAAQPDARDLSILTDAIRELRAQVAGLNAQVDELRAEGESARAEVQELRLALNARGESVTTSTETLPQSDSKQIQATLGGQGVDSVQVAGLQSRERRFEQIEEKLGLSDAKLNDQYQTKVESGSKYRLRLSGIVLLNLFKNRGNLDNLDVPELALPVDPLGSNGSFGGSLRQSQIGLQVFGPNVGSAHTSADVKLDFAGTFPAAPNGVTQGSLRLRTGTIRMDGADTSIVAGQDTLFFAPLAPTSLASLAVPALSYSGNLWGWIPQIRVEHRTKITEGKTLSLQAGILDSFSGDIPYASNLRDASWGEQSGQPAYALRLAWTQSVLGQSVTLGFGGFYGRQSWGLGRKVDGWAGTTDLTMPLGKYFALTGEFYQGRATAGIGGGAGQDVVISGSFSAPTTVVRGVESRGGWLQLKFKPRANLELNGAFGQENPFARDLRRYPGNVSYFGPLISRNQSELGNFIYHLRSNVLFSLEYRHLHTSMLDSGFAKANQVNAAMGYLF